MVNYRGSTGYVQKSRRPYSRSNGTRDRRAFGVSAALRRYLWIDASGGASRAAATAASFFWLVTQTQYQGRDPCRRSAICQLQLHDLLKLYEHNLWHRRTRKPDGRAGRRSSLR